MRTFFIRLVLFVAPVMVLCVVLDVAIRLHPTVMRQKAQGLTSMRDSIELLVLGTSHAAAGIDPRELDLVAFNAAMGSQSLYFDQAIARKHWDDMPELKYVFISVDYHSFQFLKAHECDFMFDAYHDLRYEDQLSWKWRVSPLIWGYGLKDGIHMLRTGRVRTYNGYVPNSTQHPNGLSEEGGRNRAVFFDRYMEAHVDDRRAIVESLSDFIGGLQSRGVTPVLLTLPCHPVFNRHMDPEMEKRNLDDIQYLCKKWDIDCLYWQHESLPDSHFSDQDHLSSEGAQAITRRIQEYIDSRSALRAQQ